MAKPRTKDGRGRRTAAHRGPNRLFTDDEIRDIRERLAKGVPGTTLADEYECSLPTIYSIKARRTYREVK